MSFIMLFAKAFVHTAENIAPNKKKMVNYCGCLVLTHSGGIIWRSFLFIYIQQIQAVLTTRQMITDRCSAVIKDESKLRPKPNCSFSPGGNIGAALFNDCERWILRFQRIYICLSSVCMFRTKGILHLQLITFSGVRNCMQWYVLSDFVDMLFRLGSCQ